MSGIKETKPLSEIDPEMFKLMQEEYDRQIGGLELIASEVQSCAVFFSAISLPNHCRGAIEEAGPIQITANHCRQARRCSHCRPPKHITATRPYKSLPTPAAIQNHCRQDMCP